MKRIFRFALLAVITLAMCGGAVAQFNAAIQGTITDQSGALVPGAKITVTNTGTGVTYNTVSTNDGFYRVSGLPPAVYSVSVDAASFRKEVLKDISVSAENVRGVNIQLSVGGTEQQVEVTAEAAAIQTENANVNRGISAREITEIPQVGRDPYELLRLTPGIFGDAARNGQGRANFLPNGVGPGGSSSSIFQTENQVQISANGQRVSANSFQVDGVGVNSQTWAGAAVITPNQESVSEVSVTAGSYSAEDGRTSGAQVKVVSKSGTNNLHGSGFFKYDEPGLNAYNKYADGWGTTTRTRVGNKLRQFGGSLGGPVIKEKAFWFFSYEGVRQFNQLFGTGWVTTQDYRQRVAQARANTNTATVLGATGIEPRIVAVSAPSCAIWNNPALCQVVSGGVDVGSMTGAYGQYVPLGTPTGGGFDGHPDLNFVQYMLPSTISGNQFNGRFDVHLGRNQFTASTYVTLYDEIGANDGAAGAPVADVRKKPVNGAYMLSWLRTISNTMLNEARFNMTRFSYNQLLDSGTTNFGIPRIEVEGMPIPRPKLGPDWSETTPGIFAENTFEFRDTLTKVWNNHAFKFGFQVTKEQNNNNLDGGARPLYSFSGLWNLANGTPIYEQINADPRTGGVPDAQRYFRSTYYAGFVQDDWKIRPNLTLNLGIRYDFFSPLTEKNNRISNLIYGSDGLLVNAVVKPIEGGLFGADHNNFAPRIGFAWSPSIFGDKGVIRGGYGLAYNRFPLQLFQNTRGNVPFFARYNLCCGTSAADWGSPFAGGKITYVVGSSNSPFSYPANPALAQGIDPTYGNALGGNVEIYGSPQNMPNAYVQNYSLEVQYELPQSMTMVLGYQGSAGRKLIRLVNQNFLQPPAGDRWYAVYFPTPDINSSYNSLNAQLSRHFTNGMQFQMLYTWSKSIDFLSNEGPGSSTNQTDPARLYNERGPSDYDRTHNMVISGIYELPWYKTQQGAVGHVLGGWQISAIFSAHSGFPWTPVTGTQSSVPITGAWTINPTRPVGYLGGNLFDTGDDAFTRQGGNFPGGGTKYFDISHPGPPGIGRNSFRGPRYSALDMTFGKDTKVPFIGEGAVMQFRANIFNIFNSLNLQPFGFATGSTKIEDPHFGMAEKALAGRVVELQARFTF
ncbi:MAG TPA: TonB-dependent receptor [Terriglobales bacterium]|nr:TonB-dependent receptor [Terriglobales bacterium]